MPRLAAYGKNINAFRHAGRGVFSGRITAREGKNAETDKQKEENRYKSIENGIQIQKKEKGKEQQSKAEKSENSYEPHAARDHSSEWVDHNKSGQ